MLYGTPPPPDTVTGARYCSATISEYITSYRALAVWLKLQVGSIETAIRAVGESQESLQWTGKGRSQYSGHTAEAVAFWTAKIALIRTSVVEIEQTARRLEILMKRVLSHEQRNTILRNQPPDQHSNDLLVDLSNNHTTDTNNAGRLIETLEASLSRRIKVATSPKATRETPFINLVKAGMAAGKSPRDAEKVVSALRKTPSLALYLDAGSIAAAIVTLPATKRGDLTKILKNAPIVEVTLPILDRIKATDPSVDMDHLARQMNSRPELGGLYKAARMYDGLEEGANNLNIFADKVGHVNNQFWCATFVTAIYGMSGIAMPEGANDSFTEDQRAAYRAHGQWIDAPQGSQDGTAKPGDAVFFLSKARAAGRTVNHVGIVLGTTADGRLITVEGNTDAAGRLVTVEGDPNTTPAGSANPAGDTTNGGGSYIKFRTQEEIVKIVGYGRETVTPGPGWKVPEINAVKAAPK